jgi:hypothetical protein
VVSTEDIEQALFYGPVIAFHDWSTTVVPRGPGVYTIWEGPVFIYAGIARQNLYTRLNAHAGGRRSGNQFCVYVCDRFVIPAITASEREQLKHGRYSLDQATREYIRTRLSFRYLATPDADTAILIERDAKRGVFSAGPPILNPA